MKNILAFSGSNSSKSINQQLVQYASSKVKQAHSKTIDLREFELPIFSTDIQEDEGIPENAQKLKAVFEQHDAFIISIPEHNSGMPAFFKNIIDWVSRIEKGFFEGKPILLMSTSPGPQGGASALKQSHAILSGYLDGKVVETFSLPKFFRNTEGDEDGTIRFTNAELDYDLKGKVELLEQHLANQIKQVS